jgi:hypothetical protein
VTIAVRETRRELYIPYTMTSNNAEWERGWFYLRNDEPGLPPWTGKVVREKADSWWHGLSPSSRQDRLGDRRAPEEEEAGIFHPKVGDRSPISASFKCVGA